MLVEVYEAYLLSLEEFSILLRASGCRSFYGFPIGESSLSRKELLLKLHQMVKKGLLKSDGEHFLMEQNLASCIRTITDAEKMLLIEVHNPPLPVYCCYPGRQILICEWMSRRDGYIKLKRTDGNKFYGILVEEGYFPSLGEGSLRLICNHTGHQEKKLTLQRKGLEQIVSLETEGELTERVYSEENLKRMFTALTEGGFYDIS